MYGFTVLRIDFQCERVNFAGLPNHNDRIINIFSYLITKSYRRTVAEHCWKKTAHVAEKRTRFIVSCNLEFLFSSEVTNFEVILYCFFVIFVLSDVVFMYG